MTTTEEETQEALQERLAEMQPFVAALCARDEVIGVGSLGGLHAAPWRRVDRLSDVDISILLDLDLDPDALRLPWHAFVQRIQPDLPDWLPNFKFRTSTAGIEVNVHQQILSYERQEHRTWDDLKCGIYVDGLAVLYEESKALTDLVREKTAHFPARCRHWLLHIGTYGRNIAEDAVPKCVRRGQEAAAWDLVHDVTGDLLIACFFAAGRWPPHPKWRFDQLRTIGRTDERVTEVVELLAPVRTCAAPLDKAREGLLRSIELVLDLGRAYLPPGERDLYGHALTHHFGDRQLRAHTAADAELERPTVYADRMKNAEWNRRNFTLGSAAADGADA